MPPDHLHDVDQRQWPLEPTANQPSELVVTRARDSDPTTSPPTVTETWTIEVTRGPSRILVVRAPTQAECDQALQVIRQALLEIHNTLPAMGT